jgi:hypothetical protein
VSRPSILEAQNISPDCRAGRGLDGAWDEAVARLREIYDAQTAHDPSLTLALAIYRGDFRTPDALTAAETRAETAEAEVARLRAAVEGLAEKWGDYPASGYPRVGAIIRAALDQPTPPTDPWPGEPV